MAQKTWYKYDAPMAAEGRDTTLLGVAFINREKATKGPHTPQGPALGTEPNPESPKPSSTPTSLWSYVPRWNNNQTQAGAVESAAAPSQSPAPPDPRLDLYATPCEWPKDVMPSVAIYPNKPTTAIGVEACLENLDNAEAKASIKGFIAAALQSSKEELDTIVTPVLCRYSMETIESNIRALLRDEKYRSRVLDMLKVENRTTFNVATSIVVCSGLKKEQADKSTKKASAEGRDPTQTVPIGAGFDWESFRKRTVKGEYLGDVVLFMSFRRVKYEYKEPKSRGSLSWGHPKSTTLHIPDTNHYFSIEKNDVAKGNYPAFFGPEAEPQSDGHDSIFAASDILAGAAETGIDSSDDENVDPYPDHYFSESDEAEETEEADD